MHCSQCLRDHPINSTSRVERGACWSCCCGACYEVVCTNRELIHMQPPTASASSMHICAEPTMLPMCGLRTVFVHMHNPSASASTMGAMSTTLPLVRATTHT